MHHVCIVFGSGNQKYPMKAKLPYIIVNGIQGWHKISVIVKLYGLGMQIRIRAWLKTVYPETFISEQMVQ